MTFPSEEQNYFNLLERNSRNRVGRCGLDASSSEQGPDPGCEHGNEPSGSIKCREFLEWVIISFSRKKLLHEVGWLVTFFFFFLTCGAGIVQSCSTRLWAG
jgi:hypothetical protein